MDGYFESLAAHIRSAICIYRYDLPGIAWKKGKPWSTPRRVLSRGAQGPGREILSMAFACTKGKADFLYVVALRASVKMII